jgi:L-2-hydroxyglutarate oxidase LhgO
MIQVDVTIVGGGMVGCAVAAESARRGLQTVLLEKEPRLACGVTARNSEVAHGGMYYPTGTLKARFCVHGRRLLKQFCAEAGVEYQEMGKLIVAVEPGEEPELERLLALGQANGVEDLRLIGAAELAGLEPRVRAVAALFSPRTGILDAEGAARAYGALAAERGAQVLTGARVTGLAPDHGGWRVDVTAGRRESWSHASRWVVNAAGLDADRVAEMAGLDVDALGLRQHWVKGSYFAVSPARAGMIRHLVYPVPPADGSSLGVHVCLDRAGQLRLGPDLEPLAERREDYAVDADRRHGFYAGAVRFLPFLQEEELTPSMAGIRPKLAAHAFVDFAVRREEGDRAGLINLIGIDSPGLTSGPALAEHVGTLLDGR